MISETIIGPRNWPKDTKPEMLDWISLVRQEPPHGGDLWLPQPTVTPLNESKGIYFLEHDHGIMLPPISKKMAGKFMLIQGSRNPDRAYKSDGASIPWLLRPLVGDPWSPDNVASCAGGHDPAYETEFFTRSEADELLYWLKIANGDSLAEAREYWIGVRAGGWWPWMHHTKASIAEARKFVRIL